MAFIIFCTRVDAAAPLLSHQSFRKSHVSSRQCNDAPPSATSAVGVQLTLTAFGPAPASVTDGGVLAGITFQRADAGTASLDGAAAAVDAAFVQLDAPKASPDTSPSAPVDLVKNGSFESGASSWKTINGNVASTATGPSGAYVLRSDTAGAWCQQDIRGFVAGKTYTVRATGKGDAIGCTVGVVMGNDASGEVQRNTIAPFGTAWTTGMSDFVVPSAATWMFVFIHNNGSTTCWTDDVSIRLK